MANDLDAIDITKPDGANQAVNVLDDYQRETRDVLVGWGKVEHDAKGRHKFFGGTTAARPSTGGSTPMVEGSIYFNTDTAAIERFNGSDWVPWAVTAEPFNYVFNGDFEIWGIGTTSAPTGWTLNGAGASAARSASGVKSGSFAAQVTRAGTDCYISQDISIPYYGATWWRGKRVVIGCWVRDPGGADGRISINDGIGTSSSSVQTAGATSEWLTVARVIDAAATKVEIRLEARTGAGAIQFDGARLSIGHVINDFITEFWSNRRSTMNFGDQVQVLSPGTYYLTTFANSAEISFVVNSRFVVRSMRTKSFLAPGAGETYTYTLRRNEADASPGLSHTHSGGAATTGLTTADCRFEKGDRIAIKIVVSASANACQHAIGLEVEQIPDTI